MKKKQKKVKINSSEHHEIRLQESGERKEEFF